MFRFAILALATCFIQSASATPSDFEEALGLQASRSATYMLNNISRSDADPGSVVASPSKHEPNYYFHWTRDAALVMKAVHNLALKSTSASEKQRLVAILKDFTLFSRKTQLTANPSGNIAEPRYNVDGSADFAPWGRPQNDGPALRAITLAGLAHQLLDEGQTEFVTRHLYSAALPAHTVIKADLEYTAHHWRESSFDVWEEIRGQHFYHRIVKRRALLEGAILAERLNDPGAADYYRRQAQALEAEIPKHFDGKRGFILATINRDGGIDYKSQLDMVTILAVLHGAGPDNYFSAADDRVMATAHRINETFKQLYRINQRGLPAVALGRYPEDRYNGYHTDGEGNPWFLLIHGMAEYYYKLSVDLRKQNFLKVTDLNLGFLRSLGVVSKGELLEGQIYNSSHPLFQQVVRALMNQGDQYLQRSFMHMNQKDGSMSEQLNRYSGMMQGATDLTWSYASLLTAAHQRRQAMSGL